MVSLFAAVPHVLARDIQVEVPDHVGQVGGMLGWGAGCLACWALFTRVFKHHVLAWFRPISIERQNSRFVDDRLWIRNSFSRASRLKNHFFAFLCL